MNKKQLIVAWIMGILICGLIISAPKKYLIGTPWGSFWTNDVEKYSKSARTGVSSPRWDIIIQGSLVVLIIGGILIYTLRDKKKWGER